MKKGGVLIVILLLILSFVIAFLLRKEMPVNSDKPINNVDPTDYNNFDVKIIKEANKYYNKNNYMISPLSIAYALSLVQEGAQDNTLKEIYDVIGKYELENSFAIKDRMSIANLIFIRNLYKNQISKKYIKTIQDKYDSEVLFDDFNSPKAINDWVAKKTFNMIKDPVNDISSDFVLGLANAIAIDVEWQSKFKCERTNSQEFTKVNNIKMDTAMMHSEDDVAYIESDDAKGIIKDYAIYDKKTGKQVYEENENTVALEYVAILPNGNVDDYINNLNTKKLDELYNSKKTSNSELEIKYSLPKYTYDFDYDKFKDSLINLGMNDAFSPAKANFKNMINDESDLEIFISQAIHKTHIELSENGTKAAAVTIFMFEKNSISVPDEKEIINIEFNRPFIYLIKEKNNNNIWFFGTVYEPMKWEDNDIKNCNLN